jgi:hypothetical protein
MSRFKTWAFTAAACATAFAAGTVYSQEAKDAPKGMSPEDMAKCAEMGAPAEQHKQLAASAGTWDCEMTMWMDPSQPPMQTKGVATRRSAMNGLYVVSDHKSEMMGMPFEGLGVDGYSKEKSKYFSFWADNMGSTPMMLWGTADASGKTVTYEGEQYACAMGTFTPRIVIKNEDADHFTFEFWAKYEGAPDYAKSMEGKYTRRK